MLPFHGLQSEGIQFMNQLACLRIPISDSGKSKSKFGFQGKSRIVPNPAFFWAEVLHIRSAFCSSLAQSCREIEHENA